jgi:hypothetical protein
VNRRKKRTGCVTEERHIETNQLMDIAQEKRAMYVAVTVYILNNGKGGILTNE